MTISKKFLTAEQVAEIFQVKPSTIYRLARENKLPHYKIGRQVRFDMAVLQGACDSGCSSEAGNIPNDIDPQNFDAGFLNEDDE